MLTVYKLSMKPDKEISCFKRISFKKEEVPLSKVLREGIHPGFNIEGYGDSSKIRSRLSEIMNEDKFYPAELKQMGYSENFSSGVYDYNEKDKLKQLLEEIRDKICFVDSDIKFQDLLEIANGQLKKDWNRQMIRDILGSCYSDFNELRGFVKSKDKDVKIPSYDSLKDVPLEKILNIDDFLSFEKVLIQYGLQKHNFRYAGYLQGITTNEGYLSLKPSISAFQFGHKSLVYNCKLAGENVACYPELNEYAEKARVTALEFAKAYGREPKYCPDVPLNTIEDLENQKILKVYFEDLNYEREDIGSESQAEVRKEAVKYYKIEKFLNESVSAKNLREILKQYDEKISGKKDEIVARYADIATQEYDKLLPELDKYFKDKKFVKVSTSNNHEDEDGQEFNILKDNPIKNLLLTMYFIKHLRGNVIFDLGYENDAYTVKDLAKALIDRKVSHDGGFVGVERLPLRGAGGK